MHLEDFSRAIYKKVKRSKRYWTGGDKRIIKDYFHEPGIRKLHIGCGQNILNGWLNSDCDPVSAHVLFLDATEPFPFENDQFHYVFSEHVIEHLTYAEGRLMLAECYRVLRPKGKLRIATPDLSFLVDLYRTDKSELQQTYIKWVTDNLIETAPYYDETFVINNFVSETDCGHRFIYDEKVLCYVLEKIGFRGIRKCDLNDSEDNELRDLENEERMPPGFLRLESIVLEGMKF